jgi:hypothetical protein
MVTSVQQRIALEERADQQMQRIRAGFSDAGE